MKKPFLTLVLILGSIIFSNAQVQIVDDAYKKELDTYLTITGAKAIYTNTFKNSIEGFKSQKPPVDQAILDKLEPEIIPKLVNDFTLALAPIYSKELSITELKEMNTFLQSPLGLKMAKINTTLGKEINTTGEYFLEELKNRILNTIEKLSATKP